MKWKKLLPAALWGGVPALGLAAMGLQTLSLRQGYDEKGLFVWTNPAQLAMMLLCIAAAAGVIALVWKNVPERGGYAQLFPKSWLRGGVSVLAGVMLALDLVYSLDPAVMALRLIGLAAAGCMVFGGVCAGIGCKPHPGFHAVVCVYFLLRLLTGYRLWGASAHLEQYALFMITGVLLMLYAFHRCSADAGAIGRRKLILTGFGAMFGSLTALAMPGDRVFCLVTVLWVAGSMCCVGPLRRRAGKTA